MYPTTLEEISVKACTLDPKTNHEAQTCGETGFLHSGAWGVTCFKMEGVRAFTGIMKSGVRG